MPEHPKVIAPPPLLYLGGLGITLALRALHPAPIAEHPVLVGLGVVLLTGAVILNGWGAYAMLKARTAINPYRPATMLLDQGPFARTRNPLYMSFNLLFVGSTLLFNTLWGFLVLIPLLLLMHYGVILREERYLEARFGEPYRVYCRRVRRYL